MSCGKTPKGSFAGLNDTWSKQSDLRMSSWDPYPGLREGYGACGSGYDSGSACGYALAGQQGAQVKDHGPTTWSQGAMVGFQESYTPCCRPQPYIGVSQTWSNQKPYTL